MKIMQVDVKVGRAEAESAEVLVLTHCEEQGLSKNAAAIDKGLGGSGASKRQGTTSQFMTT